MQPRRIVVGIDFSDASLAAGRWAALHFAPDAEVVLVHVAPTPWVPSFARAHVRPPAEISAALGPALYGALRGLAELVDPDRTRVEHSWRRSAPESGVPDEPGPGDWGE